MTPADLIVTASSLVSLDPSCTGTAVAVADGMVVAVGGPEDLAAFRGPETRMLDVPGGTITPGLNDSHTHVALGLELTRGLQLTDVGPLDEIARRLRRASADLPPDAWVLGWGLDPNLFNDIGFRGTVFDDVSGGRPVLLRMRDGHSAVANAAALAAAGVTGRERFDDESRIDVDDDGHPTGYLLELGAIERIAAAIPSEGLDDRADRLHEVLTGMAATGITSTHVMDFADGTAELVARLESRGELPIRLRFSPWVLPGMTPDDLERIAGLQGSGGRRWVIEGVKFFIDGTVDNGSAWLEEPDCHGQGTKSVWSEPEQYRAAAEFFISRGIPTATHAIGDQGVRFALEVLEAAGAPGLPSSHRIEHIETAPDDTIGRFAALGVAASMQPIHGTHHTRADRTDNWSLRLGVERAERGWRCRDLRASGAVVALGSDWPITPFDPRRMMADSILRRPVERPGTPPIQPEQALTPLMALEGYTSHAAAAAGLSDIAGSITPGKRADLTVFTANPLTCPPEDLPSLGVAATVVAGRIAHLSPALVPGGIPA